MSRPEWIRPTAMPLMLTMAALLLGSLAFTARSAQAQDTIDGGCMEEQAGFGLNCTANDVQVAGVRELVVLDDGCAYPGDTVTFQARFEVVLTAQGRHDIGVYFATDGDGNGDGAVTGVCSISTLPLLPDPPYLDLDGTADGGYCSNDGSIFCTSDRNCRSVGGTCAGVQDQCGDIDASHNPLFPLITLTTNCIDPDGNGQLNLPNCTSWRQPGANELCEGPEDAFPGAPSKCRCDLGFEIPILVPTAELGVTKTALPGAIDEPGAVVEFMVGVTNQSPFANVNIDSLVDNVYGDFTMAHDAVVSTTCAVPQLLLPGQTYSCAFRAHVTGHGGTTHEDTVTASGTDENNNSINGSAIATVTIRDLKPSISLVKTASPTQVLEPGGQVTFSLVVTNQSGAGDPVTITSLVDDVHGDLDGRGDCSVPQTLQPGAGYGCSFSAVVSGNAGDLEVDVITADGVDDEGNGVSASDSATVNINDVPSMIELTKTANPTSLEEPGGVVTFSFLLENTSPTDTVEIDTFTDSIFGDLNGQGDCSVPQTLVPGSTYACSFSAPVEGNAFESETNVATASGLDDDGIPVSDDDDATVNFTDVAPSASLVKTATSALVTFQVEVTNDSAAEPLVLESLEDDVFGDITLTHGDIERTDCSVPQTLAISGSLGDTYVCSFEAWVRTSAHVDTVTGTLTDDEGNGVQPTDDARVGLE